MKKLLLALTGILLFCSGQSQNQYDIYGVEMEYTSQFGYRYFFDRMDLGNGAVSRIKQLPVKGYYNGAEMMNCKGNHVFLGVDSNSYSVGDIHKLYEIDTATGTIVNSIITDTSLNNINFFDQMYSSTDYVCVRFSGSGQELIRMDMNSGAVTVVNSFPQLETFHSDGQIITKNDVLWFSTYSGGATGTIGYLYKMEVSTGVPQLVDTIHDHYYSNIHYDCQRDSIFGFLVPSSAFSDLNGSEFFHVDQVNDSVIRTGTIISGCGTSKITSGETMLHDGRYLVQTSGTTVSVFGPSVAGSTYSPQNYTVSNASMRNFTSASIPCEAFTPCGEAAGMEDHHTSLEIGAYPNPSEGYLQFSKAIEGEYEVVSLQGKVVRKGTLVEEDHLDLSALHSGLYLLRVKASEGETYTEKVLLR